MNCPGTAISLQGSTSWRGCYGDRRPPAQSPIGQAFRSWGRVVYVTTLYGACHVSDGGRQAQVIDFPIVGHEESKALAAARFKDIGPRRLSPSSGASNRGRRLPELQAFSIRVTREARLCSTTSRTRLDRDGGKRDSAWGTART